MPRFQKREYHPDTTEKHALSDSDIAFLKDLQKELNTQPSMGNADPIYWGIVQDEEYPTSEEYADGQALVDQDYDTIARDLRQLAAWLDGGGMDCVESAEHANNACRIVYGDGRQDTVYSLVQAAKSLNQYGEGRFEVKHTAHRQKLLCDCLFLTHKDCEDHLKRYGYNYNAEAHAYAMTAVRSPRYGRLLEILKTVDWSSIQPPVNAGDGP